MNVFGIMDMTKTRLNKQAQRAVLGGRFAALAAIGAVTMAATLMPSLPASAAEHSLAGIRIFASVRDVLNKYGDPNSILTGASAQSGTSTAGPNSPGGAGGTIGGPPAGFGGGQIGAVPPMQFGGMGGPGGPPAGFMGGMPGGMMGGQTQTTTTTNGNPPPGEVLYVYNRPGNITVDFLISPDGRVIQITVLGYKAGVLTERGVGLGTNYGKIVARYGYPEGQDNNGIALTMTYLNRDHVSFTLKNEKVVGITVAAIE